MSRRSAQRKADEAAAAAAAAGDEEPQPVVDLGEDEGPVAVAEEPSAPVPVAASSPKKKSRAKKAVAAAAPVEAEPEPVAVPEKKKKRAPKKKGEKRQREADEDAEAEAEVPAEEEAAPVASAAKEKAPVKRSEAGRAQGSRFDSVKVYRSQLKKHRESAPDTKKDKDGKEVPIVHRKAKQGSVAKREVKFLSKANGLYLGTALVRRLCGAAIKRAIPIVRQENERTARRLEARGKPVPQNLTVPDKWSVSPGVVQLARGAIQERVNQVATLGSTLRQHAGRETILERDIATAREILRHCN